MNIGSIMTECSGMFGFPRDFDPRAKSTFPCWAATRVTPGTPKRDSALPEVTEMTIVIEWTGSFLYLLLWEYQKTWGIAISDSSIGRFAASLGNLPATHPAT